MKINLAIPHAFSLNQHKTILNLLGALGLAGCLLLGLALSLHAEPIHTKLVVDGPPNFPLFAYKITPDGSHVVYVANGQNHQLFSVPIQGGEIITLNRPLPPNATVDEYWITPDGAKVVYYADQDAYFYKHLYVVPTAGGNTISLTADIPEGALVFPSGISPDGKWVLYKIREDMSSQKPYRHREIRMVSINGGKSVVLAQVSWRYLLGAIFTPDSKRVVFVDSQDTVTGTNELYSVAIDGGAPVKLSLPEHAVIDWQISPDSSKLYYWVSGSKFFSVPTAGGTPVEFTGITAFRVGIRTFSADGSKVILTGTDSSGQLTQLYVAPASGGAATLIATINPPENELTYLALTPDEQEVLFVAGSVFGDLGKRGAYRVPITGGAVTPVGPAGPYSVLAVSPAQDYLFYSAHSSFPVAIDALVKLDIASGEVITLDQASGIALNFSPDGNGIIYRASRAGDSVARIYQASITATQVTTVSVPIDASPSWSPSDLKIHDGKICVAYSFPTSFSLGDIYSSCFDAVWKHQVYLPVVAR